MDFKIVALAAGLVIVSSSASACIVTDRNPCSSPSGPWASYATHTGGKHATVRIKRHHGARHSQRVAYHPRAGVLGARPRQWCGWWLRQHTGRTDPSLNLAKNWLKFPRTSPAPGAVVVWSRGRGGHVGQIVRMVSNCTAVVISGNDGGAVRTRERNICNAIGFVRA